MKEEETGVLVDGAAQVIAHYGHWPSFHDADFVKIDVDMTGPTVTMEFRLYDWDQTADKAKRPRIVVTWRQVESIKLSGIDEMGQNAVSSLTLTRARNEKGEWLDTIISSTGTGTDLEMRAVSVHITHFETDEHWQHENIDSWQEVQSEQMRRA